ncbi:MAG: hypothetical protein M3Y27_07955, partial [Acidobacteriota bacterium]|nr:hypothetical protein [Acidobacteriota bacterium]
MKPAVRVGPTLVTLVGSLLIGSHAGAAQPLPVGPIFIRFTATADSFALPAPEGIGIGRVGDDKIEFKLVGIVPALPGGPNFVVVSPSSGVAPTLVLVGLNPNVVPYLGSGSYALSLQFAPAGQSCTPPPPARSPCGGISVFLDLNGVPQPSVSAVVSAASLQPVLAPGEIVSIFGEHLSTPPITAQYDSAGLYPTDLSHIMYQGDIRDGVTFNGTPAALLYVSTSQINAQVPYEVAGQKTVNVVVTHNLRASPAFS